MEKLWGKYAQNIRLLSIFTSKKSTEPWYPIAQIQERWGRHPVKDFIFRSRWSSYKCESFSTSNTLGTYIRHQGCIGQEYKGNETKNNLDIDVHVYAPWIIHFFKIITEAFWVDSFQQWKFLLYGVSRIQATRDSQRAQH